jgi:cephalosporin hydroxylase
MSYEDDVRAIADGRHAGQMIEEIAWFLEKAKSINPSVIVEIGIYAGGNLKLLSSIVTDSMGLVIGMDYDWSHWNDDGKWDLKSAPCEVVLLDGNTHYTATLEKLQEILNGRSIDVLFIDGDHGYDGCRMDFEMYTPLVRDGGLIAIHDTQMHKRPDEGEGVRKCGEFWDDIPEPKYEKHIAQTPWDGYGIGYIVKGEKNV